MKYSEIDSGGIITEWDRAYNETIKSSQACLNPRYTLPYK